MYLGITGGSVRLRTPGNAAILGGATLGSGNKIAWQTLNMYVGGEASGDITQNSELEPNWGHGKSLYVENIVYRLASLTTDDQRSTATGEFSRRGNGVLVLNGNCRFTQGSDTGRRDMSGLNFRLYHGTTCFNSTFLNYSYTQNNIQGLQVESAARMEGVGTFNTRNPNGNGLTNKFANIYGTIAPGCSHMDESKHAGTLTYIGTNFTFKTGSRLEIKAGRNAHDTLALDASPVKIESNVTLALTPLDSTTAREPLVVLDNRGDGPIIGTFLDLPEGVLVFARSEDGSINKKYRISYHGGDGNDVALTPLPDTTLMLLR